LELNGRDKKTYRKQDFDISFANSIAFLPFPSFNITTGKLSVCNKIG